MKQYATAVTFLIFASFVFSQTVFAEDPITAGKAALERGDLTTAISEFRDAVRKEKKDPAGYVWLATALLKADSAAAAETPLIQARELSPNNPAIYEMLGDVYMKQNFPAGAIPQYERASELDSIHASIFLKLARANMKSRQYTPAGRAYLRAIALDTTNIDAFRELGKLYFQARQYANAVPLYERLVQSQPDSLNYQIQLVTAYYYTKAFEKIIPIAKNIFQKDSNQVEILRMLGSSYVKIGDHENAVNTLLQLEKKDSLEVQDYIELGKALKSLERFDEATVAYEKGFRVDSTKNEIYYDLGTLYMKRKRWPDAVSMFEKKIASDTSSGYQFAAHLNIAMCLMQVKDFSSSRSHILSSIEIRPENVQAWLTLAQCYAQLDSTLPQRTAYRKVIELATSNGGSEGKYNTQLEEAYRMEGFHLLVEKKYPSSIEYLKKALQLEPKNCNTLLWAAQASALSNLRDEAKKYYCKVLEACPKSKEAKDAEKGLEIMGVKCGQ